ncbi:carbohydrate binding domain-containing protein [Paenibacillus hodogayensis]|uniref:Carbohydrate binding domain-containing protein n=1 Tax=Paenibacillus hodogayensis TaxID=279208 RepID=A0ABV5VWX3_9BACL
MHLCRKSWLSLLLSFCLTFQLIAAFQARTAAASSGNLVANPGFEEVTGVVPAQWKVIGNAWGEAFKAAPEAAHTGNYGVSIQTSTGNNPWVAIPVPVEEGATYNITTWFKAIGVNGNVGYKFEFYKGIDSTVENWVTGYSYQAARTANDGQWHELEYNIQVPPESAYMYVYLRLYGTGTVYFDDLAAVKTKDKPQIIIEPSQRYFYPDVTNGSALIKLEPSDGSMAGKTVDVRFVEQASGHSVFEQNGIAAEATLNVAFPTSGMALEQPYQLQVELKDEAGQRIELETCAIYRWERPTSLPQNGPVLVDGQPFFPVIAYHAYPEDYPYLKEIGVNTIQGTNNGSETSLQSMLDTAQASGLKVLVPLYLDMKVKENFELTRQVVTKFKSHPAVLAYMIMDEPSGNGIPQSELLDAYKLIRSIDPVHPTYMVEVDSHYYRSTGQATDILVTDVYPYNQDYNQPISAVGDGVRKAAADVDGTKPVWTVLQTFKHAGTIWNYLPTIDQLRNMAYQAFLAGSKGLGYYSINDPGWKLRDSALWPGLVNFKDEIALMGDLVSAGNKAAEHIGSDVQWAIYAKGQEQYAVAINLTKQAQTAVLPLAQAGSQVELLYGAPPQKSSSWAHELSVNLGPEQSVVYRITPLTAGIDRAVGELQGATGLIANHQWLKKTEKLIQKLLKVKQELTAASVDAGKAMSKSEKALDGAGKLKNWVSGKSDLVLEGKREQLNALLDDVTASIMPILQSMALLDLQAAVSSLVQGDEWALSAEIRNVGDKAIQNARLRIELPEAMGIPPIETQFGKIKSGESAAHSVNPVIPATLPPGDYVAKATLSFEYKGSDIQVAAKRAFTVLPLLAAKLTPGSMDVTEAGTYPFSVELTNGSDEPITVELERTAADGVTVDLPGAATLTGHETKTVQGAVTIPAEAARGNYAVTVETRVYGVSYGVLPFTLSVDTNPVYNGGFEKVTAGGARKDGWYMRAGVWDNTVAHSGQSSAKLIPDASNAFNVLNTDSSKEFPLAAGTTYKLTGWVKTEATAGSVALGVRQIDAGGASVTYTWAEAAKTGDWTKVEVVFTALTNTKRGAVYFKLDQAANGAAWVDDLELNEVMTVLDAQLTPSVMDIRQAGAYSFAVELTNGTNHPITVDLPRMTPNGITMTLDDSVALAAREKRTVQGSVYVPASVTKDTYGVTIEAKVGDVSYATLPLQVNVDTNLVYNSSFEKITVGWARPDGWSMRAAVWDQTVARTGQYSAKLIPDANDTFNVLNTDTPKAIAVTSGHRYVLSGWVKNSATAGSVALGVRQVDASGGSTSYLWTEGARTGDWTKVEVAFTALPQTKTVWIYFKIDQAANGAAWVDDLELNEVPL